MKSRQGYKGYVIEARSYEQQDGGSSKRTNFISVGTNESFNNVSDLCHVPTGQFTC
jgi:hypothetical protein